MSTGSPPPPSSSGGTTEAERSTYIAVAVVLGLIAGLCILAYFWRRWHRVRVPRLMKQHVDNVRDRELSEAPMGILTMVFSDIEGSTFLWEIYPEEMDAALDLHHDLVRSLIQKHHGYEVKTEGDAFRIAFSNCSNAISFCLALQKGLLTLPWPTVLLEAREAGIEYGAPGADGKRPLIYKGLRVRMGMATGLAEREFDARSYRVDYHGPAVTLAAAVQSVACGGQILIDDSSRIESAAFLRRLGNECKISPLGSHYLREIFEPITLYQVEPCALLGRQFQSLAERAHIMAAYHVLQSPPLKSRGDDDDTLGPLPVVRASPPPPLKFSSHQLSLQSLSDGASLSGVVVQTSRTSKSAAQTRAVSPSIISPPISPRHLELPETGFTITPSTPIVPARAANNALQAALNNAGNGGTNSPNGNLAASKMESSSPNSESVLLGLTTKSGVSSVNHSKHPSLTLSDLDTETFINDVSSSPRSPPTPTLSSVSTVSLLEQLSQATLLGGSRSTILSNSSGGAPGTVRRASLTVDDARTAASSRQVTREPSLSATGLAAALRNDSLNGQAIQESLEGSVSVDASLDRSADSIAIPSPSPSESMVVTRSPASVRAASPAHSLPGPGKAAPASLAKRKNKSTIGNAGSTVRGKANDLRRSKSSTGAAGTPGAATRKAAPQATSPARTKAPTLTREHTPPGGKLSPVKLPGQVTGESPVPPPRLPIVHKLSMEFSGELSSGDGGTVKRA